MSARDYSLFGLKVRSEIALPELFADESRRSPDVVIRRGSIESTAEPGLQSRNGALVLNIAEVAMYEIASGSSIVVDPLAGVPERNVRLFLLGSAFGALLHQRGLLPLHANAIEIDGKAVAFMGASGAGKSTLAAWFHDRGHRVLADDVCVVRFDGDGLPFACAGLPRLRLWLDAIEQTGREPHGFDRSYVGGSEQLDKFDVPLRAPDPGAGELPLALLYGLERAERLAIEPVTGIRAAQTVFDHTYRGDYLAAARGEQSHWESSVRLVRSCPVFRVTRQWDVATFDSDARRLLDHARAIIRKETA